MKGLVLLAGAVGGAFVLWGSAAGASSLHSARPLVRNAAVSKHRIPLSGAAGLGTPRTLDGVPAKGSYAFLLELYARPTGRVYDATLSHGLSAARAAAVSPLHTATFSVSIASSTRPARR